jgi:phosphatidylglycerol:prolipoprotein diacylglycerol transferase
MTWWQNLPEHISPVIFSIGSFELRWYSVMYLVAFIVGYLMVAYRLKHERNFKYDIRLIQDLFLWSILGLLVGGRIGYVLFYNFNHFAQNPLEAILPFSFDGGVSYTGLAGMSFHGGVIGIIVAAGIFLKVKKVNFWKMSDLVVPGLPLAYTFGRIGNFLNGELWGRATESSIGMYFPQDPTGLLRHPSQLYEAFLEGILLFVVLWMLRKKGYAHGTMLGLFLIGYAVARIIAELFREPDAHLGFIFGQLTMGQILSIFMILAGAAIICFVNRKKKA